MKLIPNSVTRTVANQVLTLRKHSPHILFAGGLVGMVTSTVLACRATLQLADTLDEFKTDVDAVRTLSNGGEHGRYPVEESKKDMAYVYVRGTYSVVRLYAPAVVVGVASIGALTGSHITLTRRNASLTAAYAAITKAYDAYRDRVRAEFGEDKELELYRGIRHEELTDENGKKVLAPVVDPNGLSPYARIFDESNVNWVRNAELNRLFIQCQQNYANHTLHARGHVFLNEVYDQLGFDHSSAGAVVGWVVGPDGDNFIDFGMFEAGNSAFVNGLERSIVLDFNVDGVIYDKL